MILLRKMEELFDEVNDIVQEEVVGAIVAECFSAASLQSAAFGGARFRD